jgi:DNA-binding protein HU-beta
MVQLYTTDIVRETAKRHRYPKTTVEGVLSSVLQEVKRAVAQGNRIQLTGFGTFYPSHRTASRARNFKTGEMVDVPEMKVARFTAGSLLRKVSCSPRSSQVEM